ncbi:MAG: class I mannose-6-phosphate isomerase [Bacteroidales bacterium]|jgi:mannose-6-phosphate isomerase|nr:class I mannose-6-phosphate isomerase [Bacteroidales bacterium]MCI1785143.1 class I mannose-6-phosphate isomerase [Bacteroidales bacterium]
MEEEKNKKLYPLKFMPIAEKVSWGGNALIKNYGKKFFEANGKGEDIPVGEDEKIGESWEISDMGFRDSVVTNGWLAGNSISDIMETYLERVVGDNIFEYYGRQFPIMAKLIDVRGRTPLMAHPDDESAEQRYDSLGKTKLWYIEDAEPGAKVFMGFKHDISSAEFYERCMDGSVEEIMNMIYPKKGDAFLIKPGTVHCAADGLIIAEIAESSDIDFNLFNWGKPTENNGLEELSLRQAFDLITFTKYDDECFIKGRLWPAEKDSEEDKAEGPGHRHSKKITENLVAAKEFTVTKISLSDPLHIYAEQFNSFIIYMCLEGEASIQVPAENGKNGSNMDNYILSAGETILIPNDITDFFLVPRDRDTILLETVMDKREDPDPYINQKAAPYLPDEGDGGNGTGCKDDGCTDHCCDGHSHLKN